MTRRVGDALAGTYLLACLTFIFLPVVVLVVFSFHDGSIPVPPFRGPTLRWYAMALGNDRLTGGMGNSLLVGAASAAGSVVLGFLAAYGLARHRVPGGGAIQAAILLPMAVSTLIVGMGLLVTASAAGLSPSLLTVTAGHVAMNLPLAFAICLAQFNEPQRRIEMAARDLGASTAGVLLRVTVPMAAPALIAAFCLCLTLSWDEFIIAFLNTRFATTLPVAIWGMLRAGLNPQSNAVGAIVFAGSIALVLAVEALLFGRRRA